MEDIIKCSTCKKTFLNNKEQVESHFGYNRLNERFKCCIRCRGYGKKRAEREKNKASESNGELKYCHKCHTAKPMDKFVMPNGKSYNKCRRCLRDDIYDSDDDDSSSSYSDQCVYDPSDYEVGFSNI